MKYDPFQKTSINHIKKNISTIVSAPTGAGKTAIAEYVINMCLANGTRAIYTAPIKALSNQKYRDFSRLYGEAIGILTGDVTINPQAPVLIMTTEIFRNKLLTENRCLQNYSWIIFDEIHYLDDFERGTVWEESLIFMPKHMRFVALSATIPNINSLADWLKSIHGGVISVVQENTRPVPLHFSFQQEGRFHESLGSLKKASLKKKNSNFKRNRNFNKRRRNRKPNRLDSLVKHLLERDRLPCIYFCFSRKRCSYLAEELLRFNFLNSKEKEQAITHCDKLFKKLNLTTEPSALSMRKLVEKGIAYHHAGMLPSLKEVIERLFTERLIKIIFTTETFALGINMPARTVVFDELRKYYGTHFGNLKTRDFFQMAGRAGRRGIDTEGFVYSRINPNWISFPEVKKIITGRNEKVTSRFAASYSTLLNLYSRYKDDLYDIYALSFHSFQQKRSRREKALKFMQNKIRLLKLLGYIQNDQLTEKGHFASRIHGYELILAELYYDGFLEKLSFEDLAIIASATVFEPRKRSAMPKMNKKVKSMQAKCEEVVRRINRCESEMGLNRHSKPYHFHLSSAMNSWTRGESFHKALSLTDADEGSLIRNFRMAMQILREMLDTPASEKLKTELRRSIASINRDFVDAEKQLKAM